NLYVHSFPTRRSSDLRRRNHLLVFRRKFRGGERYLDGGPVRGGRLGHPEASGTDGERRRDPRGTDQHGNADHRPSNGNGYHTTRSEEHTSELQSRFDL